MAERRPGISEDQLQGINNHENHSPVMSFGVEQNSNSSSPWKTGCREATVSSDNSSALTRSRGDATSCSELLRDLQVNSCYCDGGLHISESGGAASQPFCGWEQRMLPSTGSTHVVFSQNSEQRLGSSGNSHLRDASRSVNGAFTKSKCSVYQSARADIRSHVHSYMHGSDSRAILYQFEHHRGSDISLYIDKYRKSITYPKMEQKSLPGLTSGVSGYGGGELSLLPLSSRCVPSSVLKPKLFVLGEGSTASRERPFTCRKVL